MKCLLYDCEIIRCIPQRGVDCNPTLQWCGGWTDYANQGISVIGFAIWTGEAEIEYGVKVLDPNVSEDARNARKLFRFLSSTADRVLGFNSRNFDDKLCLAHGIEVGTHYDVLEEVRVAAFGSSRWQDTPRGRSYALGALAEANGMAKTGTGELAPVLWQRGKHQEVIDYCLQDVKITVEILQLGLAGELTDPNTGKLLTLRGLE